MRVLVVLYYWPPSGGPGVQRGVKLCRDLLALGIEPRVVTVDPEAYRLPGEYAPDPTLAADVPPGLRVVRTAHGQRTALRTALSRLRVFRVAHHLAPRLLFERQAGWLGPLTASLLAEIRDARPDVLLTSSQPYVAHLAGLAAKRATGIPWVADFRDPWTHSWARSWPSWRAFRWEERAEEEVLAAADAAVANTPGSRTEWLARRPWMDPRRIVVARNGYDPEDLRVAPAAKPEGEFRIVHAGSFRARPPGAEPAGARAALRWRGPEPVPYDLSTHSPLPLFRAVAASGDPSLRVRLVGSVDPRWRETARSLGIEDRVDFAGYLPHREAAAEVLAADLLWLPAITRRDGGPVSNVPAKTYEYLGSGRPVLAYAGPGDVRDTVSGRPRCRVADPADPAAADAIARVLAERPAAVAPDPPDAHPFRRSETARAVAAVLRRAAGRDAASLESAPVSAETAAGP